MTACGYGILALFIQIHRNEASTPAVISFLLASPWANLLLIGNLFSLFFLK